MTLLLFGKFGLPEDAVATAASVLAIVLVSMRARVSRWVTHLSDTEATLTIRSLALLAALSSLGYYYFYLRGGPRIIDATYYWLQAKTFASGHLTLPLLHPSAAQRGRFLYFDEMHSRLSVLFPPGYAAVLALGMLVKAPVVIGPCIAAGLVFVTAALARRVFDSPRAAVAAALLSVICVALRYHTADTMSHGWAALLFATALYGALGSTKRDFALAGFAAGWLFATRPVTAMALAFIGVLVLRRRIRQAGLALLVGALPGIALWLIYQRVTTGSWFHSTQMAYYGVADGPPGCFRYGFGSGIGCQFEHGTFVAKRMPDGYGLLEALTVTGVRLRWHLLDVLNFEPLALLLLLAARALWHRPHAKPLLIAPLVLLLAYAPFYFDGNYPGGGARLLADVIPIEHVLLAGWVAGWPSTVQHGERLLTTVALALLGFAVHGSFEHRQLQRREGGRPMFESSVVSRAGVNRGLILVSTDHGFALGHEPGAFDAQRGVVVARERGDAHDRVLWEMLGSPAVYRYSFPFTREQDNPKLQALEFRESKVWRFEAEAEWPVLRVQDAWAVPSYPPAGCVSASRALLLRPTGDAPAVDIALPVAKTGRYGIRAGWVSYGNLPATLRFSFAQHRWTAQTTQSRFQCGSTDGPTIELNKGESSFRLEFDKTVALDWLELTSAD